jgi:hypothetical protein
LASVPLVGAPFQTYVNRAARRFRKTLAAGCAVHGPLLGGHNTWHDQAYRILVSLVQQNPAVEPQSVRSRPSAQP